MQVQRCDQAFRGARGIGPNVFSTDGARVLLEARSNNSSVPLYDACHNGGTVITFQLKHSGLVGLHFEK